MSKDLKGGRRSYEALWRGMAVAKAVVYSGCWRGGKEVGGRSRESERRGGWRR